MLLLFNIDFCDLFFQDFSTIDFVNDIILYDCGPALNEVMNNLEITAEKLLEWFRVSSLKANASKCHLLNFPYQPVSVNFQRFHH